MIISNSINNINPFGYLYRINNYDNSFCALHQIKISTAQLLKSCTLKLIVSSNINIR